jgi:class 3 adenylate cyclase
MTHDAELDAAALAPPPDAPDPESWRAMIADLLGRGLTVDDLAHALRDGEMLSAIQRAVLWESRERLTIAEIAERAGMPVDVVRHARRLLGLADPGDEAACAPAEVELFASFQAGINLFGLDLMMQYARVIGTSTGALAEAAMGLFWRGVGSPMRERSANDAETLLAGYMGILGYLQAVDAVAIAMRLQFQTASARLGGLELDEMHAAVAFVDLVASTAHARDQRPDAYATALGSFDRYAAEAANRHDVRLVKLLGDGAMLAGRETAHVAAAALDLLAMVTVDDRLGAARAGIACGEVSARDGDYFGTSVNLAARAAAVASPGQLLADAPAAAELGDAVSIGAQQLKGFDEPVELFRITPGRSDAP